SESEVVINNAEFSNFEIQSLIDLSGSALSLSNTLINKIKQTLPGQEFISAKSDSSLIINGMNIYNLESELLMLKESLIEAENVIITNVTSTSNPFITFQDSIVSLD